MLPSGYVVAHVHLGYAATEHGNQGDTTHTAIELVTDTTSRRGLYVGATRGRTENLMLVVTESHDLDEARDILERVLINDRVDLPAIAQRRQLAEAARPVPPGPQRPASRCTIPDWFDKLEADIDARLRKAVEADQRIDAMEQRLRHQLAEAEQRHQEAERLRHNYIGTEHLLLGLIREEGGVAARVLRELGLEAERVDQFVERLAPPGKSTSKKIDLSPGTQQVLQFAFDEAKKLGSSYVSGVCGGLYVHILGLVEPALVFNLHVSAPVSYTHLTLPTMQ